MFKINAARKLKFGTLVWNPITHNRVPYRNLSSVSGEIRSPTFYFGTHLYRRN